MEKKNDSELIQDSIRELEYREYVTQKNGLERFFKNINYNATNGQVFQIYKEHNKTYDTYSDVWSIKTELYDYYSYHSWKYPIHYCNFSDYNKDWRACIRFIEGMIRRAKLHKQIIDRITELKQAFENSGRTQNVASPSEFDTLLTLTVREIIQQCRCSICDECKLGYICPKFFSKHMSKHNTSDSINQKTDTLDSINTTLEKLRELERTSQERLESARRASIVTYCATNEQLFDISKNLGDDWTIETRSFYFVGFPGIYDPPIIGIPLIFCDCNYHTDSFLGCITFIEKKIEKAKSNINHKYYNTINDLTGLNQEVGNRIAELKHAFESSSRKQNFADPSEIEALLTLPEKKIIQQCSRNRPCERCPLGYVCPKYLSKKRF